MEVTVLQGIITEDGKLQLELPIGIELSPGPVEIEIRRHNDRGIRLGDLLESELVGLWSNRSDIEDSVEFARDLRRRASRRTLE